MKVDIIIPEKDGSKAYFRLLENVNYLGCNIPAGFVTDGISAPKVLQYWFPPIDTYFLAAVLHDYLLWSGYSWDYSKKKMFEALDDLDIPNPRKSRIKAGVTAWGFFR